MRNKRVRWASLAFVAGGLLMAVLWIVLTTVHGPTSYNQDRAVLGRTLFFWGTLLSAPPNLLVALGLVLLYPLLVKRASRLARAGYALALIGLVVPAGIDLIIGALGPPFFVPIVGLGLILLALGNRHNPRLQRPGLDLLMLIGIFQVVAFALALIPLEVSDQIGGYRLYGIFAHFLTGIGWVVLGANLWTMQRPVVGGPVQN